MRRGPRPWEPSGPVTRAGGGVTWQAIRDAPAGNEKGRLRWVLGVPLLVLQLIAAFSCWPALTVRPSRPRDEGALAGIELACLVTIVTAAPALLIALTRSARPAFGRRPAAPPRRRAAAPPRRRSSAP